MLELKSLPTINCQDADVKAIVRNPMDDDKILVQSRAEMTPVPHEPSEFEKLKHQLTHIPFQPYIILQCDPEPSLINEAESVISKRQERTSAAHHDDHIKATKQSKTVRNSCKDRSARCWQHCKTSRNADRRLTAH